MWWRVAPARQATFRVLKVERPLLKSLLRAKMSMLLRDIAASRRVGLVDQLCAMIRGTNHDKKCYLHLYATTDFCMLFCNKVPTTPSVLVIRGGVRGILITEF